MRQIIVDSNKLTEVANKVEQEESVYEKYYTTLYEEVDKMAQGWSGKDNLAFTNQIKSYNDDFKQISIIMKQYVEFLKNSARAYNETQDELYSQAQRLRG